MIGKILLFLVINTIIAIAANSQQVSRNVFDRCGTMEQLQLKFQAQPGLKLKFEEQRARFNKVLQEGKFQLPDNSNLRSGTDTKAIYTIPVVFHIVLTNPNTVTDAQVLSQLDTLNKAFSGLNGDSVRIPSWFKPLFGKGGIQFCLAQRTPEGEITTGIERISTTQTSFSPTSNPVKHRSTGGSDYWDSNRYLNVWICALSNNILGYATLPNDGGLVDEQGVVVDYRALPGSSTGSFNGGKTLTHELGHYFNLYHIWGDDNGSCSGSDFIDDTPNQAGPTLGFFTGIKTDNCTPAGSGIMYQNYMDYSDDATMVLFTKQQVTRMEAALAIYRSSLLTSNGCLPPALKNYDAHLRAIVQPEQRICTNSFTPIVTIRNKGAQTLTSLTISTKVDNGSSSTFTWSGSLASYATANVTLNNITTTAGNHTLTVYISSPNNNPDEDPTNDTLSLAFQYYPPVTSVLESFEGSVFPPSAWDIVNPDNFITWKRVSGIAKTGSASVMIDNFNYNALRQKDDLRLPTVNLSNVDSAFLSFHVAAAVYTSLNATNNAWDTLEVLISTYCGQSYTSLYKKYANNLITRTAPLTTSFIPTANEWRKDSLNLANYLNGPDVLIAFRNTNGNENIVYLDDVRIRTVIINPNLKRQGILITPNPTPGVIAVQFYPPPTNLRAIQVYNSTGQKITEVIVTGPGANLYNLNISNQPPGMYVVRVVYSDRVVTRKIIKL